MRVFVLASALIAVYWWRRRAQAGPATGQTVPSLLILTFAGLLALWILQEVYGYATFWRVDVFEWLPLGACAVGAVIGYILADQQPAAERVGPAPTTFSERLFQASRGLAGNVALAALVIVAVVPPRTWADMIGRVQGFKAGGMELTLGAVSGTSLARDIAKAAAPRPVGASTDAGIMERSGFVPVRLGMMQSYTYPPKLNIIMGRSDEFKDPSSYILADTQEPAKILSVPGDDQVRQVRRDRAIAWKMQQSRPVPNAGPLGWLRPATDAVPPPWMVGLGRMQERLLAGFGPHIECLSNFVKQTKNRRLLEYQNFGIVENLFVMAHLWTVAERSYALAPARLAPEAFRGKHASLAAAAQIGTATTDARDADPTDPALEALATRIEALSGRFIVFGKWATIFLTEWNARTEKPDAASQTTMSDKKTDDIIAVCGKQAQPESARSLRDLADDLRAKGRDELGSGWFSPYLSVFVAQTLSALGDHASAIELLVQWIADLDDIVSKERAAGRTEHQAIADWYRLQVFNAIIVLQTYSEGSDISIPQQTDGLRVLIKQYFSNVLTNMNEEISLKSWRQDGMPGCIARESEWKQAIIFSFATWIKQYLDIAADRVPQELGDEDLDLALLLEEIDVRCFSALLGERPTETRFSQAEQHLQFVTTATNIRYLRLSQSENYPADEQLRLRRQTEASLRSAIMDLERAQGATSGVDRLRSLVYGRVGNDVLKNAKNLQRRLEELPRRS